MISQVKANIASNLKKIRKIHKLTVKEMAGKLDINARTYGAYERCEISPSIELIVALYEKFDFDPLELLFNKLRDNQDITTIITKLENIEKIISKR